MVQILSTKVAIPRPGSHQLARPHLLTRLHLVQEYPFTLVSAPAGFGKTTLLSSWAAQSSYPVAWVSLDVNDNDATRFWTYVFAALNTVQPNVGDAASSLLHSPQPPPIESILATLINALAALPSDVVLILDDYHLLTALPIHNGVQFLLDRLPPQLHLVIVSRSEPPLPLARLRGRRQLLELRTAELCFTLDETAAFLRHSMNLALSPDDILVLEARTEGWIVGLQLVGLSIQGCGDPSSVVATLTGSHRYILDYLAEEVLLRQSEEVQIFLLRTSLLDRLSASLCDMVTGQDNGQHMLEQLERANLFLVPLDDERGWYRYHHLFAEFLSTRLRQTQAHLLPALHHQASVWYEQHGFIPNAIDHAFAANEYERAAHLVASIAEATMWQQHESTTLLRWLDQFPTELVRSHAKLCFAYALIWLTNGSFTKVEAYLHDAEAVLTTQKGEDVALHGKLLALHAFIAVRTGDAAHVIELSLRALERLPQHEALWRGFVEQCLAAAYFSRGDVESAQCIYSKLITASRASGEIVVTLSALSTLAEMQMMYSHLRQAAANCQEALDLAMHAEVLTHLDSGYAELRLGSIYYEWNDLQGAREHLRAAVACGQQTGNMELLIHSTLRLMYVVHAQGDSDTLRNLSQQMKHLLHTVNRPEAATQVSAYQAQLWLMQGNIEEAARWVEEAKLVLYTEKADSPLGPVITPFIYLAWAQVLLTQDQVSEALGVLTKARHMIASYPYKHILIKLLALQAVALFAQGEIGQAATALLSALSSAEQGGYIRTFIDLGTSMATLLSHLLNEQRCATAISRDYIHVLLSAQQQAQGVMRFPWEAKSKEQSTFPNSQVVLSEREREVVRLMAAGLSDKEIAQRLVLAESTIKSHAKRIYARLNVKNRLQAVECARVLNLL